MSQAPILLTAGEPASIAPEITAKAWVELREQPARAFCVLGDARNLMTRCVGAGLAVPVVPIRDISQTAAAFKKGVPVLDRRQPAASRPGFIDTRNSGFVIDVITEAAMLSLQHACSALVTNPINKEALYGAGFRHKGHTDFLASLSQAQGHEALEVMMIVAGDLRTVPVTIHVPLKDVPQILTKEMIVVQAFVVAQALQLRFGIEKPRIAVTGLNPHAGENGAMGEEEKTIIIPAIEDLRQRRIDAFGPLPADTAFHAEARATYDAILCMYHDQALIPAKTLDFHGGVNVTLGLPFIRTSPDHGTALSIAGQGIARADSLIAAINLAAQMAGHG